MRIIAATGASGTMGRATVAEFIRRGDNLRLRLLLRPSRKNRRLANEWVSSDSDIEIVWGDLLDPASVRKLLEGVDVCLHMGGMVSPLADWQPEKTMQTNVGAVRLIVDSIRELDQVEKTALVYIGSVAQYGPREEPFLWGGAGDPMMPAAFDTYALSKVLAERIVADSGLKRWGSFRQSGILDPSLLFKGSDPITFHVPVNGVLEWATAEDSARLMAAVSADNIPDQVWGDFHDIGGGVKFRLTNHEFESLLLKALSCPPPEKVFGADWFATRNFHGVWYRNSDRLQRLLPFREDIDAPEYFRRMASKLPFWFKLTPLVPAAVMKFFMKRVASNPLLGTLGWRRHGNRPRLQAHYHPGEPETDWKNLLRPKPSPSAGAATFLPAMAPGAAKHPTQLTPADLREVARSRGGILITALNGDDCLGEDAYRHLEWKCARGHTFRSAAATVAAGGHWCPDCGYSPTPDIVARDPLIRSAWLSTHGSNEMKA